MQYQVSTQAINGVPSFLMDSKPLTMTSLQIAEYTGKEHKNVMRDIREMEEALGGLSFELSSYKTSQNKDLPMYELDEEQSICLVSGYDVKMRMVIIKEWKALKEANDPMAIMGSMNSNQITLFARTAVELAKETKAKESALIQIKYQKPKVDFYDDVVESDGILDMNTAAKLLGVGRNKLFDGLRRIYVLQKGSHKNNHPYQQYIDSGYFVVKMSGVVGGFVSQTFVTPKGMTWLHKKVKEYGIGQTLN